MGALTKRPLFILFCQQPKRRGECPPNAIIQSTPPQRYTCFPLSETDNFSSCDTETCSRVSFSNPLLFPSLPLSLSPFSMSCFVLFYSPLRLIVKPPPPDTNVSTGRTTCSFFADICSVSDRRQPTRSRASRKDQLDKTRRRVGRGSHRTKCGTPPHLL